MKRAWEAWEKEECEREEALLWAVEEEEKREAERKKQEEEEKQWRAEAALEAEREYRAQGWRLDESLEDSGGSNGGRRSGKRWTWKTRGLAYAAGQGRSTAYRSK